MRRTKRLRLASGAAKVGWIALAALVGPTAGCSDLLVSAMVTAPNRTAEIDPREDPHQHQLGWRGIDRQLRVTVGPPEASLRLWVVGPAEPGSLASAEPRGTILLLHGFRNSGFWLLDTARRFADAGYRSVLVDLRGHGRSTGRWLTYGLQEARDLSQVIDALKREGLLAGGLGVYGISYGGATAIHLAARDGRVDTVVSVASFSDMRKVVPRFVRQFVPIAGWFVTDEQIQRMIDEAGRRAGFDPDRASPVHAIRRTDIPILLVHGKEDSVVPLSQGKALHRAAPDHTKLRVVEGEGHLGLVFGLPEKTLDAVVRWFDRRLAAPDEGIIVRRRKLPTRNR